LIFDQEEQKRQRPAQPSGTTVPSVTRSGENEWATVARTQQKGKSKQYQKHSSTGQNPKVGGDANASKFKLDRWGMNSKNLSLGVPKG